jgi:hypothetical protein
MERQQIDCRNYSNLYTYRSRPPPIFGKGIRAPYFSSYPMSSEFPQGERLKKGVITFKTECCDTYNSTSGDTYINSKILRQKK